MSAPRVLYNEHGFRDMYTLILQENSLKLSGEYVIVHCDYDVADIPLKYFK